MFGKTLVGRDPALAALMGVTLMAASEPKVGFGSDFGFGDDFGLDDFGADDFAGDFGDDFGAAPVAATRALAKPTASSAMQAWQQKQALLAKSKRRQSILEPNKGSLINIERYAFTLSQNITLGTQYDFSNFTGSPDVKMRPQRVTMNAPAVNYAYIDTIRVGNVLVTVGTGSEDAFNYNANGVGMELDMPTITPSNRATITGEYTGFIPPGYVGATAAKFTATFRGPAEAMS